MNFGTDPTGSYLVRALSSHLGINPEAKSTEQTVINVISLLAEQSNLTVKKYRVKKDEIKYFIDITACIKEFQRSRK